MSRSINPNKNELNMQGGDPFRLASLFSISTFLGINKELRNIPLN